MVDEGLENGLWGKPKVNIVYKNMADGDDFGQQSWRYI
jgi:hypothetical protein